jgi:hypothetical protein
VDIVQNANVENHFRPHMNATQYLRNGMPQTWESVFNVNKPDAHTTQNRFFVSGVQSDALSRPSKVFEDSVVVELQNHFTDEPKFNVQLRNNIALNGRSFIQVDDGLGEELVQSSDFASECVSGNITLELANPSTFGKLNRTLPLNTDLSPMTPFSELPATGNRDPFMCDGMSGIARGDNPFCGSSGSALPLEQGEESPAS